MVIGRLWVRADSKGRHCSCIVMCSVGSSFFLSSLFYFITKKPFHPKPCLHIIWQPISQTQGINITIRVGHTAIMSILLVWKSLTECFRAKIPMFPAKILGLIKSFQTFHSHFNWLFIYYTKANHCRRKCQHLNPKISRHEFINQKVWPKRLDQFSQHVTHPNHWAVTA